MAIKRKFSRGMTVPAAIVIGAVTAIAIALLGSLLVAYMVLKESISAEGIGTCAAVILVISAAAGSWIAAALSKEKKLMATGLTALAFFLVLLSITAVFFEGRYSGIGFAALMIFVGAGVTLLPKLRKNPRKNKIKIPAYR